MSGSGASQGSVWGEPRDFRQAGTLNWPKRRMNLIGPAMEMGSNVGAQD